MNSFKCRICDNADGEGLSSVFEVEVPLAADVTEQPMTRMKKYPLHVVRCNKCGHVQLRETLDHAFYGEYLYTPSYASGFAEYIDRFVSKLCETINKSDRSVIEIGSSNGFLLSKLQDCGWTVLGVEPSEVLSEEANRNGIKTYKGFFSKESLADIKNMMGKPDVIIIRHVMEHLDNLNSIVDAIKDILGDGLLLIEVPYLQRIITERQFYAFFHEHLSYYSVTTLRYLLGNKGIYIHRVFENDLEGGSILIAANTIEATMDGDNINLYLDKENTSLSAESIESFSDGIIQSINSMKHIIAKAKNEGKKIAAWGAGQRGCTLINICGFQSGDISYVIDVNKNYWKRYVPGTDIQIVPDDYYIEHPVDIIIIFATGYAESIISENQRFSRNGGQFVTIA